MKRLLAQAAVAAALAAQTPAAAGEVIATAAPQSLPAQFVQFFFEWKSQPQSLRVSQLKVLNTGGDQRVLCGMYDLPGQQQQPFLVLGDAAPTPSAAWEPGSFPEADPLYPQLMRNLRLCLTGGAPVTKADWGDAPKG
jgi:hypothetical protein